jgi:gamma-glutamylaminecyclotransferase
VPCIVEPEGSGHHVIGEIYEVDAGALARMDRLELIGESDGYQRIEIEVEKIDTQSKSTFCTVAYLKREDQIPPSTPSVGPLSEYTLKHTVYFHWQGAD